MSVFIWQRPTWPRFSWEARRLIGPAGQARFEQGLLLGRLQMVGAEHRLEASRRVKLREAADSAVLEGLDADRFDEAGFTEVLGRYQEPLTLNALCDWHHKLSLGGTARWRDASMPIDMAIAPPPPETLDAEVAAFLTWFNAGANMDDTDPILRAAIGHLWWMTLRPFAQGNGVIACLITCLLLARADNTAERFYSLSAQMLHERSSYELGLERTQKSSTDITAWLVWFLGCFLRAVRSAPVILDGVLRQAKLQQSSSMMALNDRQRAMIARLGMERTSITTTIWAQSTQCSQDTAYRDILDLIAKKVLRRDEGGGRSTRYSLIAV